MSIIKKFQRALQGLLIIIIILFFLSISLYILYLFTGREELLPISQAFTSGTNNVILLVAGAVIASFIGAFFSAWSHEMELEETRKQIVSGFHHELTALKIKIKNIQHDNSNRTIIAIQKMIPLYSRDSLFYVLRKEIYSLENEIANPLIELYNKITVLADIQESLKNQNSTGYHSPEQIMTLINDISREIDVLLPILERREK